MSRHDDWVSIQQMRDHALEAIRLIEDRVRDDLDSDRTLVLSLTRLLEIIGESASRVSIDTRKRYASIRWRGWIGLRNRLIHAYDEVDYEIV
jgi:uncharacterized protein with HEPN domain